FSGSELDYGQEERPRIVEQQTSPQMISSSSPSKKRPNSNKPKSNPLSTPPGKNPPSLEIAPVATWTFVFDSQWWIVLRESNSLDFKVMVQEDGITITWSVIPPISDIPVPPSYLRTILPLNGTQFIP